MNEDTYDRRELMAEAAELRQQRYPFASEEAWRRERLFRYLYWLQHREHPGFNLVGCWEIPDLLAEIARWRNYARLGYSETDVMARLVEELENRFGKCWRQALAEGTAVDLARQHMPIWDEATGSLVPASLGPLMIFNAVHYPDRRLGASYHYGRPELSQKITLAIYDLGLENVNGGIDDQLIVDQFQESLRDLVNAIEEEGGKIQRETVRGPGVESLVDVGGRELDFVSCYLEAVNPDGERRGESLALRGFCGNFLKVRYTRGHMEESFVHPELDEMNSDLAEYVGHFMSQRGDG